MGASCYSETHYYTFFLSNNITPNGDGRNEVIDFSEISTYENFEGNIVDNMERLYLKSQPP
ncbi:hypothetical protein [Chryseobacterium sp.]|uniref:hypothetical protein n=1 Tax=Chryseobacterium sp. TaxID=1871047 RepID=UPI0025BFAED5|nr:hypothetical protein [Chryseobacterium sp.]